MGGELIPAVDNVTTFDTIIPVETYNELFTDASDTTRSSRFDEQFLGYISNDPLFGKTTAALFLELKPAPSSYKFSFGADKNKLKLDSVVLVLNAVETYGDESLPQRVNVFEIAQNSQFRYDSTYLIRSNPLSVNTLLGTALFTPRFLKDTMPLFKEKGVNQLRIRLDPSFGQRLLQYDSSNAYFSDSAFRKNFKGFAVYPDSSFPSNALIGISLLDTNTKLALYYRIDQGNNQDSATVTYFRFTNLSASANLINRNYKNSQLATYLNGSTPDNLVFIQGAPGSFARIKIPALRFLNNRVVHRAELTVQQVYDPSDRYFPPPPYLYVDAFDSAKKAYRVLPYDVLFNNNGELNAGAFGMISRKTTDASGDPIHIWRFNISRYIQHVLNGSEANHELRLHAPFTITELYRFGTSDSKQSFTVNPAPVKGRVRLGGSNHLSQPMQLRIIYSRL